MDGWGGFACQAAFLSENRPDSLTAVQPRDSVLTDAESLVVESVGGESVPEGGSSRWRPRGGIDQVRINPITARHHSRPPSVEGLLGEAEHPAGPRDGDTVGGGVKDQREPHFGGN